MDFVDLVQILGTKSEGEFGKQILGDMDMHITRDLWIKRSITYPKSTGHFVS